MSLLTVLPRLTSWGSHQKGRALGPIEDNDMNRDLKQDIYSYQSRYDIAIARSSKKRKPRRKKISYWSDEEAVSIRTSRYPTANVTKEETKASFTTTWRPQTTFGYTNGFDSNKYRRTILNKGTRYTYQSNPHIIHKTRNITSGVLLKPIDRVQTPFVNSRPKKKFKKRKDRKRSSRTENKASQEKETIILSKESASLVTEPALYEYNSDFEDFEDDSSNDEGFASGQATSMGDAMSPVDTGTSQFTPRLATMHEEDEENEDIEIDSVENEETEKESYVNEERNIVSYKVDLEAYFKPEDLEDENDLLQLEQSLEIILQPYVESLVLKTISQSLLETMEEESEFAGSNKISNLKLE